MPRIYSTHFAVGGKGAISSDLKLGVCRRKRNAATIFAWSVCLTIIDYRLQAVAGAPRDFGEIRSHENSDAERTGNTSRLGQPECPCPYERNKWWEDGELGRRIGKPLGSGAERMEPEFAQTRRRHYRSSHSRSRRQPAGLGQLHHFCRCSQEGFVDVAGSDRRLETGIEPSAGDAHASLARRKPASGRGPRRNGILGPSKLNILDGNRSERRSRRQRPAEKHQRCRQGRSLPTVGARPL